jgi:phosphoenolpyruvate-protein phosphotransferase (PTS system enzyme I)
LLLASEKATKLASYHGQGLGGGIAIGRARVLRSGQIDLPLHVLMPERRAAEVDRLRAGLTAARADIASVADHLPADAPHEALALLEVHRQMLDDPTLSDGAEEKILTEGINAAWAWSQQIDALAEQFENLSDPYLRERGRDVVQVGQRVLQHLLGDASVATNNQNAADEIVVAHEMDPADLLKWKECQGYALDLGGVNSHVAIVARSLQRPAVLGLAVASDWIDDGDWLILDGDDGVLIHQPSAEVLQSYRVRQAQWLDAAKRRGGLVNEPAVTKSGVQISLYANIELPREAAHAISQGAQGVGLFRSEFLFLDRPHLPSEDEQTAAYTQAIAQMNGFPVTIRTIDVGADKALQSQKNDSPANPALGERAIRFSLRHPDVFMTQLRALLRAAQTGPLRILIPMLAHRFEVEATKRLVEHAREQLSREYGKEFAAVPLGAMIEIPAAALDADWFAQEFDFLSIGTNDLVQYTLAVDRTDHRVAALYDARHPSVLALIRMTIDACAKHQIPVTVCGEMAGQPDDAQLLIEMGIRHLSMQPSALLAVKERIRQLQ